MSTRIELARDSLYSIILHLAPRLANVILFILVGRLAGPSEAGVLSLAVTYLFIFTAMMRGLDDLVIRQVSREPDQAPHYLTSFLVLELGLSILSWGILLFIVLGVLDYAPSTTHTILTLALSLVPENLTCVAQSTLMGERRFGVPAATIAFASAFKLFGGVSIVLTGGKLHQVAWIWCIGSLIGMIVMLIAAFRQAGRSRPAAWVRWYPITRNWRQVLVFFSITALLTLESQADVIMLGAFHNERVVGWYTAATTVVFSLTLFSQAYQFAVYPLMTRYALHEPDKLSKLYQESIRYLGMIALPMVCGIALLAPQIVSLVYGPEFEPSVATLRILIFSLICMFLGIPNSRMMLVHNRQGWSWVFVACNVVVNLSVNLILAPSWGARGAALARLCSSTLFFLLNHFYVTRHFVRLNAVGLLLKPAIATLVMAAAVWAVRAWPLPVTIGVGVLVYAGGIWRLEGTSPGNAVTLLRRAITSLQTRD